MAALACNQGTPNNVVYVTATVYVPPPVGSVPTLRNPFMPTLTPSGPTATPLQVTPNPTYPPTNTTVQYTVRDGDTLVALATLFGTDLGDILRLNPALTDTSVIMPGQVIAMP